MCASSGHRPDPDLPPVHYHQDGRRGFLPAGLVEEIRALHMPQIPWEVELVRWFAKLPFVSRGPVLRLR